VEKYCRAGQATDENIARAHYAYSEYREQGNIQKYAVSVRTSHHQAFRISFLQQFKKKHSYN
jgi:hypothetical protein